MDQQTALAAAQTWGLETIRRIEYTLSPWGDSVYQLKLYDTVSAAKTAAHFANLALTLKPGLRRHTTVCRECHRRTVTFSTKGDHA